MGFTSFRLLDEACFKIGKWWYAKIPTSKRRFRPVILNVSSVPMHLIGRSSNAFAVRIASQVLGHMWVRDNGKENGNNYLGCRVLDLRFRVSGFRV